MTSKEDTEGQKIWTTISQPNEEISTELQIYGQLRSGPVSVIEGKNTEF